MIHSKFHLGQEGGSRAVCGLLQSGKVTLIEEMTAGFAAFRPNLDNMICFGDTVDVMLNQDDGVPLVNEAVEEVVEAFDITAVQTNRRFFEEVEVARTEVVLSLLEGR